MEAQRFDEILEEIKREITQCAGAKGREYSGTGDERFHNFIVAGAAKGETKERALWGMYIKHWVSVQDLIYSLDWPDGPPKKWLTPKFFGEKLLDSIIYHCLLYGMFVERASDTLGTTSIVDPFNMTPEELHRSRAIKHEEGEGK